MIFFIVFPFVQLIRNDAYNQPYSLIFGILYLASSFLLKNKILLPRKQYAPLLIFILFAIFSFICFTKKNMQEIKYLISFISPIVYIPAVYSLMHNEKKCLLRIIKFGLLVWMLVGLMQAVYDPLFMTALAGNLSEVAFDVASSGRGVLSLAPEPWYHAAHIILLTGTYLVAQGAKEGKIVALISIGYVVLVCSSASGIICIICGIIVSLLLHASFQSVLRISTISLLLIFIIPKLSSAQNTSRLSVLINTTTTQPDILLEDASINARLAGLISSVTTCYEDKLYPHGLSHENWLRKRNEILNENTWMLNLSENGFSSGLGIIFYQAGFFFLPLFLMILKNFKSASINVYTDIFIWGSVFVALFQFSLSSGIFWCLYTVCMCNKNQ